MASSARQRPGFSGEVSAPPQSFWRQLSTFLYRRPWLIMVLLLLPPLIWLGVVYLGSLAAMMVNSFYIYNSFTSQVTPGFTLANYARLFAGANPIIVLRSAGMAAAVTAACALMALPVGYYMARYASKRARSTLYIAVLLPLWSSYIVRVYAWKTILANEGVANWFINNIGLAPLRDALLALPTIGGESLSVSMLGMFLVFVYVWLPYMILPVYTSLERVPQNVLDASADLGAKPLRTFWQVTLPLAMPGVVAGSIFTFSLTLGDYIIPSTLASTLFIGNVVERNLGASNNLPLAAAMTVVPMIVMVTYLAIARKTGAFDAL
jgi:putative spermidine/putrescine transport system permease protein